MGQLAETQGLSKKECNTCANELVVYNYLIYQYI
jgi:hypothetical protein